MKETLEDLVMMAGLGLLILLATCWIWGPILVLIILACKVHFK